MNQRLYWSRVPIGIWVGQIPELTFDGNAADDKMSGGLLRVSR